MDLMWDRWGTRDGCDTCVSIKYETDVSIGQVGWGGRYNGYSGDMRGISSWF